MKQLVKRQGRGGIIRREPSGRGRDLAFQGRPMTDSAQSTVAMICGLSLVGLSFFVPSFPLLVLGAVMLTYGGVVQMRRR